MSTLFIGYSGSFPLMYQMFVTRQVATLIHAMLGAKTYAAAGATP